MPKAIPVGLERDHVLIAINDLENGFVASGFGTPTKWQLIHESGNYPPKAAIGIAFRHLTGNILPAGEFSSGEAPGQAVHELRRLGFTVERISEIERMREPDCWLLLEKSEATRISKGIPSYDDETGIRYSYDSLVPNFKNLKSGDRVIIRKENQIVGTGSIGRIDRKQSEKRHSRCTACRSTNIRKRKNRQPEFRCGKCKEEFSSPAVTVTPVTEFSAVIEDYKAVEDPPSVVAVKNCSVKKGGIKSQRSQLSLLLLDKKQIYDLLPFPAEEERPPGKILPTGNSERRQVGRTFEFAPGGPSEAPVVSSKRRGQDPTVITQHHKRIQKLLYDKLVVSHGNNVACEQLMASGNPADIVVEVAGNKFEIYEIKTAETSRECIRQAIGQLLEYAFWPRSPAVSRLFVVGPVKLDSEAENYLQSLISNFQLPIEYLYQPLEN